jgi:HEPN domain-containing protein
MPQRHDPLAWLESAREHLGSTENVTISIRHRCFHGQRAVELALKAVLIHHGIVYPFTHELDALMELLPDDPPDDIIEAAALTPHAVFEMYPDTYTDIGSDHAIEAVELARTVVEWASSIVEAEPAD